MYEVLCMINQQTQSQHASSLNISRTTIQYPQNRTTYLCSVLESGYVLVRCQEDKGGKEVQEDIEENLVE